MCLSATGLFGGTEFDGGDGGAVMGGKGKEERRGGLKSQFLWCMTKAHKPRGCGCGANARSSEPGAESAFPVPLDCWTSGNTRYVDDEDRKYNTDSKHHFEGVLQPVYTII